jgi:pantetheine-phosphate adenylyltransferase
MFETISFPTIFGCTCLCLVLTASAILMYPLLFPTVITFPWEKILDKENCTVIFAASYDPPHNGHLALLEYLLRRYTKVIAVIGYNPTKQYRVSPKDRAKLLQTMIHTAFPSTAKDSNIQVEVVKGYIWRYAKQVGATIFFRGIRSWNKDGSDERSLHLLNTWGPILYGPFCLPIHTIYIEGNPKYNHVSSTLIRDICSGDHPSNEESKVNALLDLVPPTVAQNVMELYREKNR